MKEKNIETSEDRKHFLQISMDPSDSGIRKANIRFISIDEVIQAVVIGPVTHSLADTDLNQPESVIDETQYKEYESLLLHDKLFSFDLHILLKNNEIISRTYLNTQRDELSKICQQLSDNSIIVDDPSIIFKAKAKLKFCVRTAEFKESDGRTIKYKEVEIDAGVDLDDGKYALFSKIIDIVRDIFRIPHSDKNESE